jgi:hypothetical protein
MNQTLDTHRIGTIAWTEHTCGALTPREQLSLAGPLLRGEVAIVLGRAAMALRLDSGRRRDLDPSELRPPDSSLATDAEEAVKDLLSPALLNHSRRSYAWGAALAALDGIPFDRETLYVAALFHDTGLPSPMRSVDFTLRSAEFARDFADAHGLAPGHREVIANAIALHHTPGVGLDDGPEAFLLSAGAGVDVFGLHLERLPDAVRRDVVAEYPRTGFKREFAHLFRTEAKQVPRGRAWYLHRFAASDLAIRLTPFRG